MQTRVADLHWILYDFVGLFAILSTIAVIAFPFLSKVIGVVAHGKKRAWEIFLKAYSLSHAGGKHRRDLFWKRWLFIFLLLMWSTILSSFVVGLTKDAKLGLQILGFGAAGICVIFGVPYVVSRYCILRVIADFEDWEQWRKRKREIRKIHWAKHGILKNVDGKVWPFALLYPDFNMDENLLVLWVGWSSIEEEL